MGISLTAHKHVQAGMFLARGLYAARACKGLKLNFVLGVPLYFPSHIALVRGCCLVLLLGHPQTLEL